MATNTTINGKNYFRLTKTVGHKMVDGKKVPIRKTFYGTSRQKAESKYDKWKENNELASFDNRLVFDILEEYEEVFKSDASLSEGTRNLYYNTYIRMKPQLEGLKQPVNGFSAEAMQLVYDKLDCSHSKLKALNGYMNKCFNWASKRKYCPNYMKQIEMPAKQKNEKHEDIVVREAEEIKLIEATMKDHALYPMIMLALYGGLRIGECMGLKWSDISDVIRIRRQWSHEGRIDKPKWDSKRVIPLHDKIKESLKDYPHNSEYIFVSSSGNLLNYRNTTRSLERAYKKYGIENKEFKAYRATFCTNLCRAGVPLLVASELMGHKNTLTTSKYYAYVGDKEKRNAIRKLK